MFLLRFFCCGVIVFFFLEIVFLNFRTREEEEEDIKY